MVLLFIFVNLDQCVIERAGPFVGGAMHNRFGIGRAGFPLRAVCLATGLLVCAFAHPAAAQNLVLNPGFESTPNNGSNTSPDWTLNPASSTTFINGSATANSGVWAVEFAATDAAAAKQGTLSQSIATVASTTYIVSFFLENQGGPHNTFLATFGGQTVLSLTDAPAFAYKQYTATIVASSTASVLAFTAQQDPADFLLDDVSVVAEGAPAPVTGGGLLSVGVAIAGFAIRRMRATGFGPGRGVKHP
jgi:hypothetical protein